MAVPLNLTNTNAATTGMTPPRYLFPLKKLRSFLIISKARIFIKATIAAPPHVGEIEESNTQKAPTLGTPWVGPSRYREEAFPFILRLAMIGRAASSAGTLCLSPYGVPYGSKPQLVCFVLHVGSPTKALTQSSRHNVSLDALPGPPPFCPAGWYKRPCSGPACRWHRLCNSSRCRSSPRTASSAHRRCRP